MVQMSNFDSKVLGLGFLVLAVVLLFVIAVVALRS